MTAGKGTLRTDLRLAWLLTRGSDRREWWRAGLTVVGAALATGFALAAVAVASIRGQYYVSFGSGLLNHQGERSGIVLALVLLLVPVLGFLGQCARVGAVHRDRRLAALRLAGAGPAQVRRIAALETGIACLLGAVLATVGSVLFLLGVWHQPPVLVWFGAALIAAAVPVLGALVSVVALRRVVASPLGRVRRVPPREGRGPGMPVPAAALGLLFVGLLLAPDTFGGYETAPVLVFSVVIVTGVGALWLTGATARITGRVLAARTADPATLIAAERLRDDPWAAARTHAAVLLVTTVGTGFVSVREVLLASLRYRGEHMAASPLSFYTTGVDLTGAAVLVALVITLCGLGVGTAESVAARRRGLAAQAAAGVPRTVLGRALLLETALPLAPAMLLAGAGGLLIGVLFAGNAQDGSRTVPYTALLVPPAVYMSCLLAAATSLPLLRRSVRPAELRYV
ncbi:ABC transporter permease [Streptomyces sp. WI04-05B]|uniref:ABC transporter permease n=1 Tax=Streptomyces TaxID=1883 RepID=UPI0029B3CB31|nr:MULTISPECIES: ABC transporter permease [unclassified Streptomyces]MDX2545481.1 ABC transporter permease [Streptomyces sp. WI04-05B]MDX2581868.1 ABC transporter permease [Streptomyces sp. WI04-05A]